MGSFASKMVDKDAREAAKQEASNLRSLSEILETNEDQKISDVFNYFKNSVKIACDYETLLDYHNKQQAVETNFQVEELKSQSVVKKPLPRASNPQFDSANELLLNKDSVSFQKRNTVKQPDPSNLVSASPILGRRGKQQLTVASSEENVRFGPFWNAPPPEADTSVKKWRNIIVGNVLLISNSERNEEDNKASDDEMNEKEQKEYQEKLKKRKQTMNRLKSAMFTAEPKDSLLPSR